MPHRRATQARKDQDEQGSLLRCSQGRLLTVRKAKDRGVVEPRRSAMNRIQLVLSLRGWGPELEWA